MSEKVKKHLSKKEKKMSSQYLFIKRKGKELTEDAKKIRFRRSLKDIMEDATQAFGQQIPIQTLYDADGNLITSIHDIQNGDTIICSVISPNDRDSIGIFSNPFSAGFGDGYSESANSRANPKSDIPLPPDNNNIPKIRPFSNTKGNSPLKAPDKESVSRRSEKSPTSFANHSTRNTNLKSNISDSDNYSEDNLSENTDSEQEEDSEDNNDINLPDQKNKTSRRSSISPMDDKESRTSAKSSPSKRGFSQTAPSVISEKLSQSPVRDDEENKSVLSMSKHRALLEMIESEGADIENAEATRTYQVITRQILGDIPPDHAEQLDEAALDIIKNHVFIPPGKVNPICNIQSRIGIVGPRDSGKSTFLNILSQKYLQFTFSRHLHRTNCFFYYDFKQMNDTKQNPLAFYEAFVKTTLEQIINQYPLLRLRPERINDKLQSAKAINKKKMNKKTPVADELMRVFLQYAVPNVSYAPLAAKFPRTPPFSSIANELESLRVRIETALKFDEDMDPFYTNLFLFPKNIALIFGFDNVHYVVDHIEYLDFTLKPVKPFTKYASPIEVQEYAKLMLSNGTYFIAAEDEERLSEILDKADERSVDLYRETEFISIDGLCDTDSPLQELKVKLESGSTILIKQSYCGGYSGFCAKWNKIAEKSANLKNLKKAAVSRLKMKILLLVRDLLQDLIVDFEDVAIDFEPIFAK